MEDPPGHIFSHSGKAAASTSRVTVVDGMPDRMYDITEGFLIMSRKARIALLSLGVLLALCSLAALLYAFWPVEGTSIQATLAPTLLAPP